MKYFSLIFTAVFVSAFGAAFSQNQGCGTEVTQEVIEWEQNRDIDDYQNSLERYRHKGSRAKQSYSIQIHIVTRSDSSGGIDSGLVRAEITYFVNDYFADMNVSFSACAPVNLIHDDFYYSISYQFYSIALANDNNKNDVINVYYVGNADSLCGWTYFPSSLPIDHIVIANSCVGKGTTLAHELGHYFSLYHTHETGFGSENVSRDAGDPCYNCDNAGDRMCDTEADPNLNGWVTSDCLYYGQETDQCGDIYKPDAHNIMSYSRQSCYKLFTIGQQNRMLQCMATSRSYLKTEQCCGNPLARCKGISVSLGQDGTVALTPSDIDDGSVWDCGLDSWFVTPNSFDCSDLGFHQVSLTVRDVSGRTATCSTVVKVEDKLRPIAKCNDITVHLGTDGSVEINAPQLDNGSYDNCGIATFSLNQQTFDCFDRGSNYIVLDVKDGSGNQDQCTATVLVRNYPDTAMACGGEVFLPNPVNNQLHVVLNRINYKGKVQLELFDLLGRRVISESLTMEDRLDHQLDVTSLPNGQYLLNVSIPALEEQITRKVMVVK